MFKENFQEILRCRPLKHKSLHHLWFFGFSISTKFTYIILFNTSNVSTTKIQLNLFLQRFNILVNAGNFGLNEELNFIFIFSCNQMILLKRQLKLFLESVMKWGCWIDGWWNIKKHKIEWLRKTVCYEPMNSCKL